METKQTSKISNTQKLLILNELSKTVDINFFDRIYINDNELINFIGKYNYDMYQKLYDLYGKPKTYYFETGIQTVFTTYIIQIVLEHNNQ